jgi:hypothetical protein
MRWATRWTLLVAAIVTSACLTSFAHPLGPVSESFIDPKLIGAWTCTSADDPDPAQVTILGFDSHQYYLQLAESGKAEPTPSRAVATRIEDATFLSVRELAESHEDDWTLMEYTLTDSGHLRFRVVDPSRFEEVADDPAGLRQRLAERLQDPETFASELSCTRRSPPVGR